MKPTPKDWPRISAALTYDDAAQAIDWLCEAFGFEVRMKVEGEGGSIVHSELTYGEGLIMLGSSGKTDRPSDRLSKSPRSAGGVNTQRLCVFVDDVDAHCAHARAKGAVIAVEPVTNDYGEEHWSDRCYQAVDPEGHHWWFMQRMRG
ncbi:MAG: VOC family protein [Polyangiales bacterium]